MSDPNPPEQPSFNRPPGGQPTTPIPSSQAPGSQAPGSQAPGSDLPGSQPGVPASRVPASGAAPLPPPPVPPVTGRGGPSGMSSIPSPAGEGAGFFAALFDFSFTNFVTPILVRLVYLLATVALVATWLIALFAGFADSLASGLVVLVLGPVMLVIYLAIVRMTLEFFLSVVRMSEDIHKRLPQA